MQLLQPAKPQALVVSDTPLVTFNIVRHPSHTLVKQYRLHGGEVVKDMSCSGRIPFGCTVTTVTVPLAKYVEVLHEGGHSQYALPSNADVGKAVPLCHKQAEGVDRSARTMVFVPGQPAVVTLDHDPNPLAPHTFRNHADLMAVLLGRFPQAFDKAARGEYYSSSSFIYLPDGTQYSGAKGFHTSFAVEDASDIPRFKDALFKRLCLAGYGYMHVTRAGQMLTRTLFDQKVLEPQQPLFAGGAHCHDGLAQRRPAPVLHEGGYLDTATIRSLTSDEEEQYRSWEATAKAARERHAKNMRAEYQKGEVDRLVEAGMSQERARQTVEARIGGKLVGDDVLQFAERGKVTVADVLAAPDAFDQCTLHDPVEPGYGGHSTAIFFANEETGAPVVFSHAHGGRNFFLCHDEDSLTRRLRTLSEADVATSWSRLLLNARLPEDANGRVLKAVKEITGTSLLDLRNAWAAVKASEGRARRRVAVDPALGICRRLLDLHYGGGATLLMTEGGAFWDYGGTHWRPRAKSVLQRQTQETAERHWAWVVDAFEMQHKKPPTLSQFVSSAMQVLESLVVRSGDPLRLNTERPSVINFVNGELWLEDGGPVLKPHQPDSFLTSCSSSIYEAQACAPSFLAALRGMLSLPGGFPFADQEDMVRHVIEMLGYAIQTRRNLKVFYLIAGPGDNGKTRLTKLLQLIIGTDAIAFDRLGGIDEDRSRFATGKLVGKQVLIDDDAEHEYLLPDGLLKKISEEKPMTAEPKFQGAFTFVARVLPIILTNSWPRTRDLSRGMRTRAQVLYLPRQFKKAEECEADDPDVRRPEVWERVYRDELAGVINMLVAGYYRLQQRGGFLQPQSALDAFDAWVGSANVVSRFLTEACEKLPPHCPGTTTSSMYAAFLHWAPENDVQAVHRPQKNKFKGRIEELGFRVQHCNKGTAVYGLKLKDEWLNRVRWLEPEQEVDPARLGVDVSALF